ncbi:MAG: hypothetical protein FJ288_08435 [Planctomycetes bacterium]|nr:hypothetical protein [Planctomycetota bacterium]
MLAYIDDPRAMLLVGLVIFGIGCALVRYRNELGDMTGFHIGRGGYLGSKSPGWMLAAFGVLLMVASAIVVVGSLIWLMCG